ncbi:MAG: hypothetical protein IJV31_09280 [Clostridia bacterium]|nr:hypothetical protein [Clostridia bacterium]
MSANIKEVPEKIIAGLLVIVLTITNFLLVTEHIVQAVANGANAANEVQETNIINSPKAEISIRNNVEKFLKISDEEGVILQVAVTVDVGAKEDEILSDSELKIKIPEIDGKMPKKCTIISEENGYKDTTSFENGVLTIVPEKDEKKITYKLVYIFDASIWNDETPEKSIEWLTAYIVNVNGEKAAEQNKEEVTLSPKGAITSVDISMEDTYKGIMLKNTGDVETIYKENWQIEASYLKEENGKTSKLNIDVNSENPFYNENNEQLATSYYVSGKIDKNIEKVLGEKYLENIKITAIDENGNEQEIVLEDTDKESQYIQYSYPEKTVKINLSINGIIDNERVIKIEHVKKLVTNNESLDIKNLNSLTQEVTVKTTNEQKSDNTENTAEGVEYKQVGIMKLQNPKAQAKLEVNENNEYLTAIDNGNQNIKFVFTLLSEDIASQLLFEEPIFNVKLPEGITVNGDIKAEIIPQTGTLQVESASIENGEIVIRLSGKQTEFVTNGANPQIAVQVPINVEKAEPNKTIEWEWGYTTASNENNYEVGNLPASVELVTSNEALFTAMNVAVQDVGESTTYSDLDNTSELPIETLGTSKVAKISADVINNNEISLEDVNVTYEATYTNNKGETQTLLNETEQLSVENNSKVTTAEKEIELPETLSYNESVDITATTTYPGSSLMKVTTTSLKTTTIQGLENAEIIDNKLSVSTVARLGDGTVLNENDEVFDGEIVEYTTTITNLTNETINDLKVDVTHTNGNIYDLKAEEVTNGPVYGDATAIEHRYDELDTNKKTFTFDTNETTSIAPNGKIEIVYRAVVNKENGTTTYGTYNIQATGIDGEQSNTTTNIVKEAKIKTSLRLKEYEENTEQYSNADYPMNLRIQNLTNEKLQNIKVTVNLKNLEWIATDSYLTFALNGVLDTSEVVYNKDQDYIEFTINELPANYDNIIRFIPFVKRMELSKSEDYAELYATLTLNNETYISNQFKRKVKQSETKITLTQTSNIKENKLLQNGDKIIFETNITNEGAIKANGITVIDNFEAGFGVENVTLNGEIQTGDYSNGTVVLATSLEPNESAKITIEVVANTDDMIKKQVSNVIAASYYGQGYESNELTFNANVYTAEDIARELGLIVNSSSDQNNTSNQGGIGGSDGTTTQEGNTSAKTYSIEGTVWQDVNEDGQIGNESKLSGITVKLIDVNNQNSFVKDTNGNDLSVTTDENGNYQFSNIPTGNYNVIFVYDTNKYELANNSTAKDYILSETKVAISNTINLTGNVSNINLGLIGIKEFDLKLDKYITKLTTQTSKETKSTEYVDKQIARAEISSKYLSGASVIVEYTLRVTNSGELAGYATKIQDNLPKDMKFTSELNKDWYMDTDGNLYNTTLASTVINPGESKDVKLILIKTMTKDNTGTTTNTAKIATTSNLKGAQEVNLSNNESKANLLVNPATGKVITYVLMVVNSIFIVLLGVYIIKRKILD